jgi:hypothetical protein
MTLRYPIGNGFSGITENNGFQVFIVAKEIKLAKHAQMKNVISMKFILNLIIAF